MVISSLLLLSGAQARAAAAAAPSAGEESLNITGKRMRIVARSALYGFGGGLVVGLASQVFQKKSKNIFMFGSLGLYAGIFLGIYVVTTSSGPAPYEGPDTYDDFSLNKINCEAPDLLARNDRGPAKPDLRVNFLNLEF